MNGKQISIGVLALLLLGLGWLAIHHFGTGDPLPGPVGTDRGAAVAASGSHGTMPSESPAEAQRTEPPVVDRDARALIFGSVVDAGGGAPVAAATVTLFDFVMQVSHRTETDEHGHYAFPITRGRVDAFRLAIDKRGAGRLVVPEVRAAIEARRDELHAGLVLHGRVRLATGAAPPPGCRVLALRLPFQLHEDRDTMAMLRRQALPPELCIDRETEAAAGDGTFLLSDLQAGRHVLLVLTAGRQPLVFTGKDTFDPYAGCEAAPANSAPAIEIVLPATGSVIVEVVDGDTATPIHDASVTAAAETTELWLPLIPIAVDPAAPHRFRVPVDLDERGSTRSFEIRVTAPGRSPVHSGASGHKNGETIVVALGRPATVLGTVRGDDGAPIQGAPVLIRGNSDHRLAGHARTDAQGAFEIGGLCAADSPMSLFCLQPDRSEMLATVPLRLVDGEVRRVDIGPGAAGTLSGRVTIAGQPQPNAQVYVYSGRSQLDLRSRTNDAGGFAFFALPADTYEVSLDKMVNGRRIAAQRSATIDTAPVHIDFAFDHRLTGRARFEGLEPGAPLPEGEVIARRLDAPDQSDRVDLGADGRFELLLTAAATYEVSFDAGIGWVTIDPPLVDLRHGSCPPVELRVLHDACDATIELRVNDAVDGKPVTGWLTTHHRNSGGSAIIEDGIYTDKDAGIGIHHFTIHSDAHRPTPVEVEVRRGHKHVTHHVRLDRGNGVRVSYVNPGDPGHRAGLRQGDRILRYGEHEIRNLAQLRECIAGASGSVTMAVRRDGADLTLHVEAGRLGIELENLP